MQKRTEQLTVLSLFSGIGGFDLGLQNAGMKVTAMCEIDKYCQIILKKNFPNSIIHTDVKEVKYETGTVDIICGGFPCQDVSIAGTRKGFNGTRSSLWFEFARIITEVRPQWVIIENVPGLLSSNNGQDFGTIINFLDKSGYGVGWKILSTEEFGLPQQRNRIYIIASFRTQCACSLLFKQENLHKNTATSKTKKQNHSTRFRSSTETNSGNKLNIQDLIWSIAHSSDIVRIYKNQNVIPTLVARMGTGGNNVPLVGLRKLTPIECERLQGFPENWTAGISDAQRYKQLGNAVSVPIAEWIGKQIIWSYNNAKKN